MQQPLLNLLARFSWECCVTGKENLDCRHRALRAGCMQGPGPGSSWIFRPGATPNEVMEIAARD